MNILQKIIEHKKKEIAESKRLTPVKKLECSPLFARNRISLTNHILDISRSGIIAEFKRKSPSKGIINDTAEPGIVVTGYFDNGASGVSVLTDNKFFGGNNTDLSTAREVCTAPLLRKDFIIDDYQIIESRAIGADAVLLIASVLDKKRLSELGGLARQIGLQVLLEIHSLSEIEKITEHVNIVGVNNRDLDTFEINIKTSVDLIEKLPSDIIRISESGISSPEILRSLKAMGYNGFLIGEIFMKTRNPVAEFSSFIKKI